jgi:hypothetical protein
MNNQVVDSSQNKAKEIAASSRELNSGSPAFKITDNRPESITQRRLLNIVQQQKKSQKGYSLPIVQRTVRIAGVQVNAIPDDVYPFDETIIQGWIADGNENLRFASWDEAVEVSDGGADALAAHRAVQWLRGQGWEIPRVDIVDSALTGGNCHGLTFGGGGNQTINFDSVQEILDRWAAAGNPNIIVCLLNGEVAHSATLAGAVWRQTLPGGPIFTSSRATLDGHYTCYELSNAGQLAAIQVIAQQQTQAYQQLWDQMRAQFLPATQVPVANRTEEQHYHASWYQQMEDMQEYTAENQSTLEGWNAQEF